MMLVNNLAQGKWSNPKLIAKRIEDMLLDKIDTSSFNGDSVVEK